MPYIDRGNRSVFDPIIEQFHGMHLSAGMANYIITSILSDTMDSTNYTGINEIIGVLECAKLEFYRRIAAPYEDLKAQENGDVY